MADFYETLALMIRNNNASFSLLFIQRDVRETISTNQPYHPLVEQNRDAHEHRFAHKVRRVNSAEENPTEVIEVIH